MSVMAFEMPSLAANLTLVGDSGATWNTTAANTVWTNSVAGGAKVGFTDGNNILISSDWFSGSTLDVGVNVGPGDVVFDIDRSLNLTYSGGSLKNVTESFTKTGPGTLLISGSKGSAATCGIEIVDGEIAANQANNNNILGPTATPFWVYVRNGAALTFLTRNQTGTSACGFCVQLDKGSTLNVCTNYVNWDIVDTRSPLSINTLKLCGGTINVGAAWHTTYNNPNNQKPKELGGRSSLYIFNKIHFSGDTVQSLGCGSDFTDNDHLISLNPFRPIEICVDEIGNGDAADAELSMAGFTWGTNTFGVYRSDLVKTGLGTLSIPNGNYSQSEVAVKDKTEIRYFLGDLTVLEGTVDLASAVTQFFRSTNSDSIQNVTVSTNGTLIFRMRNMAGGASADTQVRLVVDHGTFRFITSAGCHGPLTIKDIVLDDATFDIQNAGMQRQIKRKEDKTVDYYFYTYGIFYVKNSMVFRGTRPFVLEPIPELDTSGWESTQSINLFNAVRNDLRASGKEEDLKGTVFDVADMTGDGNTDVTMAYHLWNGYTTNARDAAIEDSGLIKTGLGTLSVASVTNKVSGAVTVAEGTMRVDGKLVTPSTVDVYPGAFIGGTGTVARVAMEAGSGFDAPAGQDKPLTVEGDLALPATGVVNISNLGGYEGDELPAAKLITATGTLSGTENLQNWTVTIDGVPAPGWKVRMTNDNVVKATKDYGLKIIFR